MSNLLLAVTSVFIWGTTWLAIKYQLGVVDPLWSVAYRFLLASVLLFGLCKFKKLELNPKGHGMFLLLGLSLFGFNYWLAYLSEVYITSGLTAVVYSVMVFMNVLNAFWFLKMPIRKNVVIGGILGVSGIVFIYRPEFFRVMAWQPLFMGTATAFFSAYLASVGNIVAVKTKQQGVHVIQSNAWSMFYGGLSMAVLALVSHKPIAFVVAPGYLLSLAYLTVFGSVVAFNAYLTLASRIGPDKGAYVTLFVPVIALIMSALFEGYPVTPDVFVGLLLLIGGNYIALVKK